MWIVIITHARYPNASQKLYLIAKTYKLGRAEGCDIHLTYDDPSLSRVHATLHAMAVQSEHLEDAQHVPQLLLADHSKHGSFVNNVRIASHELHRRVFPGDVVRLGLHTKIQIHYSPCIVAMSPCLSSFRKREIELSVCRIGGVLTQPLSPKTLHEQGVPALSFIYCTDVVSSDDCASLTAMMYRYILVSPDFLTTVLSVLNGSPGVPMLRWPQPRAFEAMKHRALVDRMYFRPEPCFFDLDQFLSSLEPQNPVHLFRAVTLLTLSRSLMDKYADTISLGGGRLLFVPWQNAVKWCRESSSSGTSHSRGNKNKTRDLPFIGLVEDPQNGHGYGTALLVEEEHYLALSEILQPHRVEERNQLRADRQLQSHDALLFQLWEAGVVIVDEENVHCAVYCNDASNQFEPQSAGVIAQSSMDILPEVEDADSNATEDGIAPYIVPSQLTNESKSKTTVPSISSPRRGNVSPVRVLPPEQLASGRTTHRSGHVATEPPSAPAPASTKDLSATWKALCANAEAIGIQRHSSSVNGNGSGRTAPLVRTVSPQRQVALTPTRRGSVSELSVTHPSPSRAGRSPIRSLPAKPSPFAWTGNRPLTSSSDLQLHQLCAAFECNVLPVISAEVTLCCERILVMGHVDGTSAAALREADRVFNDFLAALSQSEESFTSNTLSCETRRAAHRIRESISTVQRAIRATYRSIGMTAPAMNASPRRCSSPTHGAPVARGSSPVRRHSPLRRNI